MEGQFIPKSCREKLVSEVKKTHFSLGNFKESKENEPQIKSQRAFEGNNLGKVMRETHFLMGSDKPVIKTETASRYLKVEVSECPYIKPHSSIDVRKTHYSLGSYKEEKKTEKKKEILEDLPKIDRQIHPESHHFKYGNDKQSHLTIAKLEFTQKNIEKKGREEIEKLKKELQKTHFEIGSGKLTYETHNNNEYTHKKVEIEKPLMNLQRENFKLGYTKNDYSTISRSSQVLPGNKKLEVDSDGKFNLRNSNFFLGSNKPDYIKTSQDYASHKLEKVEKIKDSEIRKTNFTLGSYGKNLQSTYKESHSFVSLPISKRENSSDKSHFVLGNNTDKISTVHQTDFQAHELIKPINIASEKHLKSSHFELGAEKREFLSQNSSYGKGKPQKLENCKKLMNDLTTTHFVLGNDKNEVTTENKEKYRGNKLGEKSVFTFREDSVNKGDGKFYSSTEQRSRFSWIKPVVDNTIKYSF